MDVPTFLSQHGVPYHLGDRHTRPGWLNVKCPWCGKDPYLGVSLAFHYSTCWSCGPHPLWETLRRLTGAEPGELQFLRLLPRRMHKGYTPTKRRDPIQPMGTDCYTEFHRDYLISRGFDPYVIRQLWGVRSVAGDGSLLKWRLWIPVYLHAELVAWTSRAIGEDVQPRYRASSHEQSIVPIEDLLYGVDLCTNSVVIVEGPTDVWRVGPGAVALLGSRPSPAQLNQLSRFPLRHVCLDAEPAAQRRARKLCNDLSVFDGQTFNMVLQSGKDPVEADELEIQNLRDALL